MTSSRGPERGPNEGANASGQPTYVASLAAAPATEQHELHVAISRVHRSEAVAVAVQRIGVGGRIVRHHHHNMWDHFVGLAGHGDVRAHVGAEDPVPFAIDPGSFLAIPPSTVHEVTNTSDTEEFVFLLFQAPWKDEDVIFDQPTGERP